MSLYGDVPLFWVVLRVLPNFWVPLWAILGFFEYLSGLSLDFWVSFFWSDLISLRIIISFGY